ncbi:NepR family anti-sigma factor [Roseovarius salincola]|uniref:NepR family anti-sigma factor n=1 Tax=Roseovarius salincola TaxID=2978479 RepID=UPI0022A82A7C|nr:NepR family anti-sigma factor [Roseovarius sp. EGI FJ00037]
MAENSRTSKLNQQIDDNLRRVYSDASSEPVPERFTRLLEQLRQQEQGVRAEDQAEDHRAASGDDDH